MQYRTLTGFAFLTLAGCGLGAPLTPSIDDADAATQIKAALEARMYSNPPQTFRCSQDFQIQTVTIADKSVTGKSAIVSASIVVKNISNELVKSGFYNAGCFGVPADGWNPGQVSTDNETFPFTLWDSGWKVADRQMR